MILQTNLSSFFDKKTFFRGKDYFQKKHVLSCVVDKDQITARVSGSDSQPYITNVTCIVEGDAIVELIGRCSCPVGYNCKHVVAALLEAAHSSQDQPPLSNTKSSWQQWLDELPEDPEPSSSNSRIIYCLQPHTYATGAFQLSVKLSYATLLKKGGFGKRCPLSHHSSQWIQSATEIDATILYHLQQGAPFANETYKVDPTKAEQLLQKLLESKRAFWKEIGQTPLQMAEPRYLTFEWELNQEGKQQLTPHIESEAILLPFSPPWYVDPKTYECGQLISNVGKKYFPSLLSAPSVSLEEVEEVQQSLQKTFQETLPLPKTFQWKKRTFSPKPKLKLFGLKKRLDSSYFRNEVDYCLLRLSFLYGKAECPSHSKSLHLFHKEKEQLVQIERDLVFEQKSVHILLDTERIHRVQDVDLEIEEQEDFLFDWGHWDNQDRANFLQEFVSYIKKKGWIVEIDPSFPIQWVPKEEQNWYFDTIESTQMQWFDLEVGIDMDGEKVNLLPILVDLIKKYPKIFSENFQANKEVFSMQLPDERYLNLPLERLQKIASTLVELNDPNSLQKGKLSVSRLRSTEMLDLADDLEWRGGPSIKSFAKKLKNFQKIEPAPLPKTFCHTLRPYQKQGLNWLQFLREYQLSGILADDMGLGKTVQALSHIALEKELQTQNIPSLVIAPTSVITNWYEEAKKFVPTLKTLKIHGSNREEKLKTISQFDLVFTTYPLVLRDHEKLLKQSYHLLILDEAQYIKNPKSKVGHLCRQIQANQRLCLTGTPMENHLSELWSLFDFLHPGFLGNPTQFKRIFRNPIEKQSSESIREALSNRIAPFLLRRTKEEVAQDLPPKTEIIRQVRLEGPQRDLYESIRLSGHKKIKQALDTKGLASSHIIILDALLKLRQVCCDPQLLKLDQAKNIKESAKMTLLQEMLEELLEEKRKILLFSSFTTMLDLIEKKLVEKKVSFVKLTGKTKNRQEKINDFQTGKAEIFLISLKAGGVGLNLTAADTVIHYDPWWNPAAEDQATDRAHRIGQNKPIFVYKLITSNTVEEKILILQEKKKALVESLLKNTKGSHQKLNREDIECLFEPLEG